MHKQISKFISYVLIGHGCPGIRILRGIAIFSKKYYNRMKGFIKASYFPARQSVQVGVRQLVNSHFLVR